MKYLFPLEPDQTSDGNSSLSEISLWNSFLNDTVEAVNINRFKSLLKRNLGNVLYDFDEQLLRESEANDVRVSMSNKFLFTGTNLQPVLIVCLSWVDPLEWGAIHGWAEAFSLLLLFQVGYSFLCSVSCRAPSFHPTCFHPKFFVQSISSNPIGQVKIGRNGLDQNELDEKQVYRFLLPSSHPRTLAVCGMKRSSGIEFELIEFQVFRYALQR